MKNTTIQYLASEDISSIVSAFTAIGWHKPSSLFEGYLAEQERQKRCVWIACLEGIFAGYVTLKWTSDYPLFKDTMIPEISDLNVLPNFQRRGIGSLLLEVAEEKAFQKGPKVGIGVGLSADYGKAQRLYVKRGYIPDGHGITYKYNLLAFGGTAPLDDDLVLWFTKQTPEK